MSELLSNSISSGVTISLIAYAIGVSIKKRFNSPLLNPLLTAIVLVILFLKILNINYEVYNESAKYLSYLLAPATVSLAVPLYEKFDILKKNKMVIIVSIFSGVVTTVLSIFVFAYIFKLSNQSYVTLLPKSITTAIGVELTKEYGGIVAITAAAIIVTGLIGNITSDIIFKVLKIENPISKGLALGTSAHAMGTVKAFELGEVESAMSSLSIVISGIMTIIIFPLVVKFI